ncbi:aminopeptidase N [Allostreptomyces psammosilenae]|uniref:Aminopeptidase N n=1 Tax=Allostreptomyces psammosilenae TaxID=1892865 RepID=A0A853A6B4_9ACTN|nr:aminopeptidase N [Allostreptomyces psammosilenae]NYI08384.1 aminopeptidase N [Allostreptomyces psammosilenae]
MPGKNLTREEAQTRADILDVESYEVSLDLSPAADAGGLAAPDGATGGPAAEASTDPAVGTFRSTTTVRFSCATPGADTFLDLLAPEVHAVTLNGRPLDPAEVFDGARVALPNLSESNEVTVDATCAYSRTGEGLHRFVDPVDGEAYLYTQYEPADARRVFANFEQPDLKASFTFTVTAPAHWTVISGAPAAGAPEPLPADPSPAAGARPPVPLARWRFEATPRISTYITAIVAGPYHVVRDEWRRTLPDGSELVVPLSALCRRSLAEHLDADAIHTVTKQGLDFFHDHFDFPYPFGKYDQAFVPEYNIGAMENPGCVTFREEYVFRSKVTDASYEARANVILHEMAHMWFGDLVTMRWWDDLWLKESFADYMGALALSEATRWKNGWITFANRRKAWAYRQDQLPTTHPVTADIRDLEDAKLNFDGITYAKGASVLKQLVAYVGRDAFMEGARRYFKAHAYANTTLQDLLDVLAQTSGRDVRAWSRAWLETAGVNALTPRVTTNGDGVVTDVTILQEADPVPAERGSDRTVPGTLRPHRVAVGAYRRQADGSLVRERRAEVDVTGPATRVPELAGMPAPDLLLVNDEDLTYCKVRFDEPSLATLRGHLGDLADPMARALAWSAVWNMTRDALMPAGDYLELVRAFAGRETGIGVLQSLHDQARTALHHYAAPARREGAARELAGVALHELRLAAPGGDPQLAWTRFLAAVARDEEQFRLLEGLLRGTARIDGLRLDRDLRWTLLEPLVAAGRAGEAEIDAELRRDATASGRRHHAHCMAARPTAEAKARAWASVMESDELPNAMVEAVIDGFNRPEHRALTAPYAERYFAALEEVWRGRTIEIAMRIVRGLYPVWQDGQETLERTDAWLAAHPDAAPALRRLVWEARDDLARAVRARECDAVALSAPRG